MKKSIQNPIICLLLSGVLCPLVTAADSYTLSADEWARPRRGDVVVQLPAVRQMVEKWMQSEQAVIDIRYPGGEAGSLWASELHDWLVALGIPSSLITSQAGSPNGDELIMHIVQK